MLAAIFETAQLPPPNPLLLNLAVHTIVFSISFWCHFLLVLLLSNQKYQNSGQLLIGSEGPWVLLTLLSDCAVSVQAL